MYYMKMNSKIAPHLYLRLFVSNVKFTKMVFSKLEAPKRTALLATITCPRCTIFHSAVSPCCCGNRNIVHTRASTFSHSYRSNSSHNWIKIVFPGSQLCPDLWHWQFIDWFLEEPFLPPQTNRNYEVFLFRFPPKKSWSCDWFLCNFQKKLPASWLQFRM